MNQLVIKAPHITEKTNSQIAKLNKYVFIVGRDATKGMIKDLVEMIYKVKVVDVNMQTTHGKTKRSWSGKRLQFKSKSMKKAIVTLKDKDSISIFTGGNK